MKLPTKDPRLLSGQVNNRLVLIKLNQLIESIVSAHEYECWDSETVKSIKKIAHTKLTDWKKKAIIMSFRIKSFKDNSISIDVHIIKNKLITHSLITGENHIEK